MLRRIEHTDHYSLQCARGVDCFGDGWEEREGWLTPWMVSDGSITEAFPDSPRPSRGLKNEVSLFFFWVQD